MPGEPPPPGYRRIHTAPTQGSLDAFLCSRNDAKNGRGADPPAHQASARRRRRRTVEVEGSADAQGKGREQTTGRARQHPHKMQERSGNAERAEQRQHMGQLRTEKRHNRHQSHQSHKCQSSRRKPIEPEEDIVLASSAQPSVLVDAGHPRLLVEDSGQISSTPPQRRQPPQQRRASGERIHQPSSGRKKRTGSSDSPPDRDSNRCQERPNARAHRRRSTVGTELSTERSASHDKRRGDSERKGHGSSFNSSSCTLDGHFCNGCNTGAFNSADDFCKAQPPVSPVASFLQRAHAKATTPTKKQHTKSEIVYVRNQLQQIKQQREVIHQRAEDAGIKEEGVEGGSFHLDESGHEREGSSSNRFKRSGFGNDYSSMWISDMESLHLSDIEGLKRSSC